MSSVICRRATYKSLRPQLPKTARQLDDRLACVHIEDEYVTVSAAALRDWLQVVDSASFWFETVDLPATPTIYKVRSAPARRYRCLVAWAWPDTTARFYPQLYAADKVWEVYL